MMADSQSWTRSADAVPVAGRDVEANRDDPHITSFDEAADGEASDGEAAKAQHGRQPAALADRNPEPETERTQLETILVMLALCSALSMAALDVTIITTAIPTIAAEFESSLGYIWVGTAYTLTSAACVPTWGKLSDIWGRKPILLLAVTIFWAGSLVAGLSRNIAMLIAARAVQGLGGGGIVVLVNICIGDLFSPRARSLYYGLLGFVWAFASAVGPVIGGVFTTKLTWRWCFYINLPISAVAMLVLVLVLKLYNPRTPVRNGLAAVDWGGSLLIIGGTLMFLFGLQFGGIEYAWSSPIVVCLIAFGLFTILLFALYECRFPTYPIMPMRIFRDPSNIAALTLTFFHACVYAAGSYWLPLYFQGVLGVSALLSGVYLLPYAIGLCIPGVAIGFIIKKTGNYKIGIVTGTVVSTLGVGLFIDLGPDLNLGKLILYQLIAGLGLGPNFQSPLIALHAAMEPHDIATATATLAFMRQIAVAITIAIGGVVFNNEMQRQAVTLHAELPAHLANLLSGTDAAASVETVATLPGRDGEIVRAAYWTSLRIMFILFVAIAGCAFVSSLFVRQRKLSGEHKEHKTGIQRMRARTDSQYFTNGGSDQRPTGPDARKHQDLEKQKEVEVGESQPLDKTMKEGKARSWRKTSCL